MGQRRGFTLVEALVAIVISGVGLLGLATGMALAARMIAQGRRASLAASLASQRIERLRAEACTQRAPGSESFPPAGRLVVTNTWTWHAADSATHRITLVTRYATVRNGSRAESLEAVVICPF